MTDEWQGGAFDFDGQLPGYETLSRLGFMPEGRIGIRWRNMTMPYLTARLEPDKGRRFGFILNDGRGGVACRVRGLDREDYLHTITIDTPKGDVTIQSAFPDDAPHPQGVDIDLRPGVGRILAHRGFTRGAWPDEYRRQLGGCLITIRPRGESTVIATTSDSTYLTVIQLVETDGLGQWLDSHIPPENGATA